MGQTTISDGFENSVKSESESVSSEKGLSVDIEDKPNAYGFGWDWTLVIKRGDEVIDSKMLGQDVKVGKRVLGISNPMEHYAERFREQNPDYSGASVGFNQVSEMIARDVVAVMTGAEYDRVIDVFVGGMELSDENLERLAEKSSWSMAVE